MRHRKKVKKLGRDNKHRTSMLRNLVTSLFAHESIRTTDAKAKEGKRRAERLITYAKEGSVAKRRLAARYVQDKVVLKKLFDEIAPRYAERQGGYTRIIKLGNRVGDNAPLSVLELVEKRVEPKVEEEEKKGKGKKK
jgi:large subunit ribosomal protein L17